MLLVLLKLLFLNTFLSIINDNWIFHKNSVKRLQMNHFVCSCFSMPCDTKLLLKQSYWGGGGFGFCCCCFFTQFTVYGVFNLDAYFFFQKNDQNLFLNGKRSLKWCYIIHRKIYKCSFHVNVMTCFFFFETFKVPKYGSYIIQVLCFKYLHRKCRINFF